MVKRKKIILIAGLLIFLLVRLYTKGHSIDVYFKAKSWTKYIKNKDAEKMVKLFCSDIKNKLNENGGSVEMTYMLDVNAAVLSTNEVKIKVREVKSNV